MIGIHRFLLAVLCGDAIVEIKPVDSNSTDGTSFI